MEFKVIPFTVDVHQSGASDKAAAKLEGLLTQYAREGWEYVRMENVTRYNCEDAMSKAYGEPSKTISIAMLIFKK